MYLVAVQAKVNLHTPDLLFNVVDNVINNHLYLSKIIVMSIHVIYVIL